MQGGSSRSSLRLMLLNGRKDLSKLGLANNYRASNVRRGSAAAAAGGTLGGASWGPPWLLAAAAILSASALARSLAAPFILNRTYVSVQYFDLSRNLS
jgi:hypothetical protein